MTETFTKQQQLVLDSEYVTLVGVDAKGRPVVEVPRRWGQGTDRWAVLKSGEPANVTEPVR